MLNIEVNLASGIAKLTTNVPFKAGGGIPVIITFNADPGEDPIIELGLSPQSSPPAVVAFLDNYDRQNETTFTGLLDSTDPRLIRQLAGKEQQTLNCEIALTVGELPRRPFPNFAITAQASVIVGPESAEGGPEFVTTTTGDARYYRQSQNLAEIATAGSAAQQSARGNLGLGAMLCRNAVSGPVTFSTAGNAGDYWFDSDTGRLWVCLGGQYRYSNWISE